MTDDRERVSVTIEDVAEAVCISEIGGSGHEGGVPCAYHDTDSVKVRRFWHALRDPDRLAHYKDDGTPA